MKYPIAAAILFAGLSFSSWHLTGRDAKTPDQAVPTKLQTPAPEVKAKKAS